MTYIMLKDPVGAAAAMSVGCLAVLAARLLPFTSDPFACCALQPPLQAASLLGLGLLYQGSSHRLMTEIMLEEIGRTPGINPSLTGAGPGADGSGGSGLGASLSSLMCVTQDREGYALAAGFGLGLICLGQGRSAPGLADLQLEDKLRCAVFVCRCNTRRPFAMLELAWYCQHQRVQISCCHISAVWDAMVWHPGAG
jgi:hypothetical protein